MALLFPTIRIVAPLDSEPLRRVAREVERYAWLVFTSVNGVERFWGALAAEGGDAVAKLAGVRFACIGPATAHALRRRGFEPSVVPEQYVAEALTDEIIEAAGDPETGDLSGLSILLPRAAGARDVLPRRLAEAGAEVLEVEAYRAAAHDEADGAAVPGDAAAGHAAAADAPVSARELRERLDAGEIDALTFTSSSTVAKFVDAMGADVGGAVVAAIGPVTAGTARELGMPAAVVAREHTVAGLIDALDGHFA